jgi:hypothetical protein
MDRRALLLLLPLAACANPGGAPGEYLFGVGDPVRGVALQAPFVLGNTERFAGDPASAAWAAAQLEFLARSFEEAPRYAQRVDIGALTAVQEGRREMRTALGIPQQESGELVEQRLRLAAEALRLGERARADAVLASFGPDAVGRLSNLPHLRQVALAGGMAAQEIRRQDQDQMRGSFPRGRRG